ncbi:MAG: transcriptional repressor [Gammaproteobacteria bacterium]
MIRPSIVERKPTLTGVLRQPGKSKAQIRHALGAAEALCAQRGSRLTALRRRVLEIVLSNPKPQGAYAILDILRDEGRRGAPPTVYRALDFLLEQGFVHRLASLNVFIGCNQPAANHSSQFLICRQCGNVSEMDSHTVEDAIRVQAADREFQVEAQMVEVLGLCGKCQSGDAAKI